MDAPVQASLTPEQIAAIDAGGGFARIQDPASNRQYILVAQSDPVTIDDQYVRQKVDEAYRDNDIAPLDMNAVRNKLQGLQQAKKAT